MAPHADYALEKLRATVRILVTYPGDIRQRLLCAAEAFQFIPLGVIPDFHGVHDDLKWIQAQITRNEPQYEGQSIIAASIDRMRSKRAVKIAERILAAESKLNAYVQDELAQLQLAVTSSAVPSP